MDAALVQQLADLVARLPEDHTDVAALISASAVLEKIAAKAKDQSVAARLGATELPSLLTKLLAARPADSHFDAAGQRAFMGLLERIGAIVPPLASVPANLPHLRSAGFGLRAVGFLVNTAGQLSAEQWYESIFLFANVAAVVLAIVLARDTETNRELASAGNISALLTLASTARNAGDWKAGEDWPECEARARVAQYLWQITAVLSEYANAMLGANAVAKVYRGFRFWNRAINLPRPAAYDAMTQQQRSFAVGHELAILVHASAVLKPYYSAQPPRLNANTLEVKGAILPFAVFIETLNAPAWVDDSVWDVQTRVGVMGALSNAFGAAASTILVLIASNAAVPDWLQPRIFGWLHSPIVQLRDVGIGALANSIQSKEKSIEMLQSPELSEALATLLSQTPPPGPDTQYSVLGLIRNLSVPEVNRERLGAPVLDAVLGLRVWSEATPARDPVQRNAMVIVQNLSTVPTLAARFFSNAESVADLIKLGHETSTSSLRALILATFADVITGLGPPSEYPEAWAYASTQGVLVHLALCLVRGDQDSQILASGARALRAVAERGSPQAKTNLLAVLKTDLPIDDGERSGVVALTRIIAPPATGAPTSSDAIEADVLGFVRSSGDAAIEVAVKLAVAKNKAESRRVAQGAESI